MALIQIPKSKRDLHELLKFQHLVHRERRKSGQIHDLVPVSDVEISTFRGARSLSGDTGDNLLHETFKFQHFVFLRAKSRLRAKKSTKMSVHYLSPHETFKFQHFVHGEKTSKL